MAFHRGEIMRQNRKKSKGSRALVELVIKIIHSPSCFNRYIHVNERQKDAQIFYNKAYILTSQIPFLQASCTNIMHIR